MGGIVTRTGTGTVTMGVGDVGGVGGVGDVGGVGGVGVSEKSIPARGSDVAGEDVAGADVAAGDSSGKKRSRTEHSSASAMAYILSMVGLPWM